MISRNEETQSKNASPSTSDRKVSRRTLLAAIAAAGVTAALGDALLTYPPWLNYGAQAKETWDTPFRAETTVTGLMRELVRYATLAPSGHNAQPWRFAIMGSTIRISPDYARRLPTVDPQDRELWISLGCALENLIIAAHHAGFETEITYPDPDADYLAVRLQPSSATGPFDLFDAIPHRQNTRSLYDGRAIPGADLKKIEAIHVGPQVFHRVFTALDQREAILDYVRAGNQSQYGSPTFMNELVSWLRFNEPEALQSRDGLYLRCTGNPELPRWLGERFVRSSGAGQQSATDEKNLRSSPGLIVIAAARDDKRHWIETGRLYERLALTLTAYGIKVAFLNQPFEVPSLRAQFQGYLGLGAVQPQLLLRFGYAASMPRSLRRPVEHVLDSS